MSSVQGQSQLRCNALYFELMILYHAPAPREIPVRRNSEEDEAAWCRVDGQVAGMQGAFVWAQQAQSHFSQLPLH